MIIMIALAPEQLPGLDSEMPSFMRNDGRTVAVRRVPNNNTLAQLAGHRQCCKMCSPPRARGYAGIMEERKPGLGFRGDNPPAIDRRGYMGILL